MKSIALLIVLNLCVFPQVKLVNNLSDSKIVIEGTSSLHDWESSIGNYKITAVLEEDQINNLQVSVDVNSIKSGKSIMDDKTYDALMSEKFPHVVFTSSVLSKNLDGFAGTGKLTLAGVTKPINIVATITSETDQNIKLTGQVPIKMSEYGIEPPSAMFGSITTGDDVNIIFSITLIKQ